MIYHFVFFISFVYGALDVDTDQLRVGPGQWEQTPWEESSNPEQHLPHQHPKPECHVIPKGVQTSAISPLVQTEVTYSSAYPCFSGSKISQLSHYGSGLEIVTCNGVIVRNSDNYDAIFQDSIKENLVLTNFTDVKTFVNGNWDYLQCGIIASGRCAGDLLWGIGIYQADDQDGCCSNGTSGGKASVRFIEIIGKCASKCSLGVSIASYGIPVNNKGMANRSAKENQDKNNKSTHD